MDEVDKLELTFLRLAWQWEAETRWTSSIHTMIENSCYQAIINMGAPVVPILLKWLKIKPDHWMHALYKITGEDPVPTKDAGNLRLMTEAWINWGREHGYQV